MWHLLTDLFNRTIKYDVISWRILLIGLLVRLVCLPIATHSDLLYTYWDAHLIVYHHQLMVFQAVIEYFHAGYLWLIANFLPPPDSLWVHFADKPLLNPFTGLVVTSVQGWFDFINLPQVFRTLFLLKLPYLFFDLGCAFLLYKLGSDRLSSRRIFAFWWLNPLVIFAVYIFSRHEVIALFLIILSLCWIKQGRSNLGILSLGLAIAIRYYAILLLPFYILSIYPSWRKRILGFVIGLTPWLIINLLGWALSGSFDVQGLASLPQDNYLLSLKFQIGAWDNLYVFPLVYILLLLQRLYNRELGYQSMVQYCLIALLLLFATGYSGQSPQYWTWFVPLLAVTAAEDRHLVPLHAIQIGCLVIYSFIGGRSTAGYLFAPLSPDFFWGLPSPAEIIGRFTSPEVTISLARTLFSAISLWIVFLIFRRIKITFLTGNPQEIVV
jgi:hypothetical protein